MLTITIVTDDDGRVTGLVVPRGAQAQIVPGAVAEEAMAVRYGADGERFYAYDPEKDCGLAPHVPRGYRQRMHMTVYEIEVK